MQPRPDAMKKPAVMKREDNHVSARHIGWLLPSGNSYWEFGQNDRATVTNVQQPLYTSDSSVRVNLGIYCTIKMYLLVD